VSDKRVVHSSDFAVLKSVQGRPIAAGIKAKDSQVHAKKRENTGMQCHC
jgi:hypothetical protein